jgi:Fe-S-cluster containining protein
MPSDSITPEETTAFLLSADKVREAVVRYLSDKRSSPLAITFVRNLQSGIDQVVSAAINQGVELACKVGCNHCCSARVEAIEPEVFRIAREIASRPAEEINPLMERLRAYVALPSDVAPWPRRAPCPFLIDELCSIYAVRPGVCRKAHSLDVAKCVSHAAEIPQNLNIVLGAEALMKGTADAYQEIGLHATGHDLGQAILIALIDPTAESRWLSGEAVFD